MFGDFEAQRHWLEVTLHLPISQWYHHDLDYWGLDYPPVTAYHSYLLANLANTIDPSWVALLTSRGNETDNLKQFMRLTVIFSELLVYIPAVYMFVVTMVPDKHRQKALCVLLIQPALILIDNGHFQYNSVMLGFALWGITMLCNDRPGLGSIFFCIAIGFKQMALYYSLAFFAFLLGKCIWVSRTQGITLLIKLGNIVVGTFFAIFGPFIALSPFPNQILQVLSRMFPVQRGLYEDKVANVWCAISLALKLRQWFSLHTLTHLSIFVTLLACAMPMGDLLVRPPTPRRFLYSLGAISLAFFLFSFQVHEKSILLPILPVCLIMVTGDDDDWQFGTWFVNIATFSMYHPLLKKDGLTLPYLSLLIIWNLFCYQNTSKHLLRKLSSITYTMATFIHLVDWIFPPPTRYPDLFTMLSVIVSCGSFIMALIWLWSRQLGLGAANKNKVM
ncbi:glycosyltransferase family 57 protein [Gonapodya prolifera JEL478]|uniref:Alpha-1,3-glucosyltransferase n=1 Tax=Gonapodya prolifera (strain JEL478) TaxID=1344416 RepID=A0A139ATW6_GONPJ|nr:glycosyltransferase family 57 protein [Gonapodya prolifera JEL478]|eukprot:KXS20139.1 glycosyltransferase family 57 protein [Gonapodya prolifera JEL478]